MELWQDWWTMRWYDRKAVATRPVDWSPPWIWLWLAPLFHSWHLRQSFFAAYHATWWGCRQSAFGRANARPTAMLRQAYLYQLEQFVAQGAHSFPLRIKQLFVHRQQIPLCLHGDQLFPLDAIPHLWYDRRLVSGTTLLLTTSLSSCKLSIWTRL